MELAGIGCGDGEWDLLKHGRTPEARVHLYIFHDGDLGTFIPSTSAQYMGMQLSAQTASYTSCFMSV